VRREESGSIGIQTLAVLVFAAAVAAASGSLIMAANAAVKRSHAGNGKAPEAVSKAVKAAMEALDADSDAECDSPLDPLYALSAPEGAEIELKEISSLINPNWLRKGILEETSLGKSLLPGKSAKELQQFREDGGLGSALSVFGDFFSEEALEDSMSVYSYANVDSSDEFALRKLFSQATGNDSGAEAFHQRLQSHLMSREQADEKKLASLLGMEGELAGRVMGIEAQMNINFADEDALRAILSYPAHDIKDSETRTRMIMDERAAKPLKKADLIRITGKQPPHPVYGYLGVKSWFWSLMVKAEGETWKAVIARRLPERMDDALGTTPPAVLVSLARIPEPEKGEAP
jgi:hypothetical protein